MAVTSEGFLDFGSPGVDLPTASILGADSTFTTERAWGSVPTDALGSMTPITPNAGTDNAWSGFFRDLTKTVVGYSIAKDAARAGVQPAQNAPAYAAQQAQRTAPAPQGLGTLLLIGAAVYVAVQLAK